MGIEALLAAVGAAIVKGLQVAGKAVLENVKRNKNIYAAGGIGSAAAAGGYAVGKSKGHKKGKVEGTVEQAKRDAKKMKQMQEKHENDRHRWNEQERQYKDILKDL
ncbi:MAG: hypothetical protein IKZ94_02095 [Lachnospiraceae bacterium]|nr:hypothetical protein [Lachnospiraceae bacterium]